MLKKTNLLFLVLVIAIALATYWRAFDINLRTDDWITLWVAGNPVYKNIIFTVDELFQLHPVLTLNTVIFVKIFGFNTFYWALQGYLLKVIDALIIALMMWGITKSKRVSYFSGLIFASFAGGLETYIWQAGRAPAIIIIPLCLGIYYWVLSQREEAFSKKYFFSLLFFLTTILFDPGRGTIILALTFFWEAFTLMQAYTKKDMLISLKRFLLVVIVIIIGLTSLKLFTSQILKVPDFTVAGHVTFFTVTGYEFILTHPTRAITNFMYSMGNLFIGWFIPTIESGHFSVFNDSALIASTLFLLVSIWLLRKLILQKEDKFKILVFFMLLIPIAYFPNWLLTGFYTGPDGLIIGLTNRYLAVSAVGLVCVLGYIFAQQKTKVGILGVAIVIILNITTANRILQRELYSRSAKLSDKLWNQIDREVPTNEQNNIFMFKGGDPVNYELVGSDAIPFGVKRGMTKIEELPIIRIEPETVREMLCKSGVRHFNALREMVPNQEPIPLSHVYAWTFENGKLTNITTKERQALKEEVDCKLTL